MLVLSRKRNEQIEIGENISIRVVEVRGDKVRVGIDAPRDIQIVRSELNTQSAGGVGPAPENSGNASSSFSDSVAGSP